MWQSCLPLWGLCLYVEVDDGGVNSGRASMNWKCDSLACLRLDFAYTWKWKTRIWTVNMLLINRKCGNFCLPPCRLCLHMEVELEGEDLNSGTKIWWTENGTVLLYSALTIPVQGRRWEWDVAAPSFDEQPWLPLVGSCLLKMRSRREGTPFWWAALATSGWLLPA